MIKKIITVSGLFVIIISGIFIYKKTFYGKKLLSEINFLVQKAESSAVSGASSEKIKKLPEPVKKYLIYSGALEKSPAGTARIIQTGEIRFDFEKWEKFSSLEYISVAGIYIIRRFCTARRN